MGEKSSKKRTRKPSDFLDRMTAPVDAGIFVDAFAALWDRLARPYVVTPEEERPGLYLSDTGQSFTLNTDHPFFRLCAEAREYCRKRNVDVDTYAGPIATRVLALCTIANALKGRVQFRPYVQIDAGGSIVGIRNDAIALAATFPFRVGRMLFDSKLFLVELLAIQE